MEKIARERRRNQLKVSPVGSQPGNRQPCRTWHSLDGLHRRQTSVIYKGYIYSGIVYEEILWDGLKTIPDFLNLFIC